jgi:protein-tyrosine-phosphatase
MAEMGIDISEEYSKGVTPDEVVWADVIVALEPEHADYLREDYPSAAMKIVLISERVRDPFNGPLSMYRARRDQLAKLVRDLPLWANAPRKRGR